MKDYQLTMLQVNRYIAKQLAGENQFGQLIFLKRIFINIV